MSQTGGRTAIPVSCEGDDAFRTLLQLLSIKEKTSIAKVVRRAIDTTFEKQIAKIMKENPSFFADSGLQTDPTRRNKTSGANES